MMASEEKEVVSLVYRRFIESESNGSWANLDETLWYFEIISDRDVINESMIKYLSHSKSPFRCKNDHDSKYCMAPLILDSVESILLLHEKEETDLHPKNRYILTYYLAMSELGLIFSGL